MTQHQLDMSDGDNVDLSVNAGWLGDWLDILRGIKNWDTKGKQHELSLIKWVGKKNIDVDDLEATAIGLATVQHETLEGYDDLARAFQQRLLRGYDMPNQNPIVRYNGTGRDKKRGYY